MSFDKCVHSCNHYPSQDREHSHHSIIFLPIPFTASPSHVQPQAIQCSSVIDFPVLEFNVNRISQHMFLRGIHMIVCIISSFFFVAELYSIFVPYLTLFIHSPFDRHLDWFQFGDIMNKSATVFPRKSDLAR